MRVLKFLVGLAGLPVCIFLAVWLWDLVAALFRHAAAEGWPRGATGLGLGWGAAGLLFSYLPRPVRAYVWGHELTHAIVALLRGGRVSQLRVQRSGGSVAVSNPGVWVTLSPYVVPPATLCILLIWAGYRLFGPGVGTALPWFFAVGLTWGFHLGFTVQMLSRSQPDVKAHGWVFSLAFILGLNLGVGILLLCAASPPLRAELIPAAEARMEFIADRFRSNAR